LRGSGERTTAIETGELSVVVRAIVGVSNARAAKLASLWHSRRAELRELRGVGSRDAELLQAKQGVHHLGLRRPSEIRDLLARGGRLHPGPQREKHITGGIAARIVDFVTGAAGEVDLPT